MTQTDLKRAGRKAPLDLCGTLGTRRTEAFDTLPNQFVSIGKIRLDFCYFERPKRGRPCGLGLQLKEGRDYA